MDVLKALEAGNEVGNKNKKWGEDSLKTGEKEMILSNSGASPLLFGGRLRWK